MDGTEGLVRGQPVMNMGSAIEIPVGDGCLGRIMNVIGEPIDERGPVDTKTFAPIHAEAPPFTEMSTDAEILVTGIKVVDLLAPYAKGGKIGESSCRDTPPRPKLLLLYLLLSTRPHPVPPNAKSTLYLRIGWYPTRVR